jgi:hypothetical protein
MLSPAGAQKGTFLLVTIPHFSEHEMVITFFVEDALGAATAVALGLVMTALAAFYLFRK